MDGEVKVEYEVFMVTLAKDSRLPVLERMDEVRGRLMRVSGVKRVVHIPAQTFDVLDRLQDCGRLA